MGLHEDPGWRYVCVSLFLFSIKVYYEQMPWCPDGLLSFLSGCLCSQPSGPLFSPPSEAAAAAAAAKSLQSCPTLCDPIDGLLPGSSVPGSLQARTLEWVAISFSNA